ncbi:MAG TPA: zf-HC2 domain-containing protein [Paraburkholderia sp.]|jgi:anti-sigma factor RsiW
MRIDDILLMAYVDGELSPHECRYIETAIAASPDMTECVAFLNASRLPYRAAFAQQKLPPIPESLMKAIG